MSRSSSVLIAVLLTMATGLSPALAAAGSPSLSTTGSDSAPLVPRSLAGIDLRELLSHRATSILLAGGVLAWFSWNLEDADRIRRVLDQPAFEISDVGDIYGDGLTLGAGAVALATTGRLSRQPLMLRMGEDLSRSLLVSGVAVWTLKLGVKRRRPNGAQYSFPSGHTAAAFAVAPVIAHHLGPKAAVPAYGLAALTGIARMEGRRHYLSDVLFGAAIGLAVGDAVVGGRSVAGVLKHICVAPKLVGLSFDL